MARLERMSYNGGSLQEDRRDARTSAGMVTRATEAPMAKPILPYLTESTVRRFWGKVAKGRKDECWLWKTSITIHGYGQFWLSDMNAGAARVAWVIANQREPGELLVLHCCDVRACCNPAHLYLGTPADNMQDVKWRNRANPRRGEDSPAARLSKIDVLKIREEVASGVSHRILAKRYDVGQSQISNIATGRQWAHVGGERTWIGYKGRRARGEEHHAAKLTAEDVVKIRQAVAAGATYVEVAESYGIEQSNVYCIVKRKTWKHVA